MSTTTELEQAVQRWAMLGEQVEMLQAEQREIKRKLAADLGVGASMEIAGLKVSVSAPSRRFNLETAATFLTDEQRELATVSSLDAAKVKSFLPPILLDQAMDPGTGEPSVRIS